MELPKLIQGGMGVGVSNWTLANAVSSAGGLGVVSGTALDAVFIRRLQDGDPGGHVRRALDGFPIPAIAERVWEKYFRQGGRDEGQPYKVGPMGTVEPTPEWSELLVVANFTEVFLAKANHCREVGVNFLEKIQLPHLPSIYGALLAGVDYVLMGAGIPRAIPGVLDKLSSGQKADYKLDVKGAGRDESFFSTFDPAKFIRGKLPELKRPRFLGIITSHVLAQTLANKADGYVDGFVVEAPAAGGHNAPPRGPLTLDDAGEPVYGPRDVADIEKIRDTGRPFWMAGDYGTPEGLQRAREMGAQGVQVGSAFAFCEESGVEPTLKARVIDLCKRNLGRVFTDPLASPTGFPFKVLELSNTVSEKETYEKRRRVCDLGYLRQLFRKEDGSIGYRCAAEPVAMFEKKGGDPADTVGRKCLCNGLMATIGLGQCRSSGDEAPIVTAGDKVGELVRRLTGNGNSYSASDVVHYILRGVGLEEEDTAEARSGSSHA